MNLADPDIKILPSKGKSFLVSEALLEKLKKPSIDAFTSVVEEHALIDNSGKRTAITIKGVTSNYLKISAMDSTVYIGEWLTEKYKKGVVIGDAISYEIGTMPNTFQENLKVFVVKPGKGQINQNSFNSITIQTIGLFRLTQEMDSKYVFAPINLVQKLLQYKTNQVSAIELKLNKNIIPKKFALDLQNKLGEKFSVVTRYQLNATFYKMLNMENLFAYLIATLIGIIAFFNVIGAIIMMILDKRENIKTLFNLGLKIKELKKIFYLQGILLTIFGMIIGLFIAFIIIYIQNKYKLFMLTESLAYPVEFHFSNLIIVVLTILSLGVIAAIIASSRISKKLIS